ncbi:MAG: hypothetical protein IKF78_13665 [Atopobiaceae bacterium]|nr:hypothetical protein [Atopobiaceae bacterium]
MSETKDEPTFIVRLTGILSPEDIEQYERGFKEQLPGRVIVVDGRVDDVYKVTDKMQPRDAIITVHHKRKEFESMSCDGNTPNFRYYEEVEQVPAKVWPVAMSSDELLVEWGDGTLGAAKLWDIRLGVMAK